MNYVKINVEPSTKIYNKIDGRNFTKKYIRTICTQNMFITYNTYLIAPVLKKFC